MNKIYLIDSFIDIKNYNNIDGVTLMTILEFSIRNTVIKLFKYVENFDIFIDHENGSIDIWRNRVVVNKIQESNKEIEITLAKQIEQDFEVGEEFTEKFSLNSLNRRSILAFKDNFYLKSKEYYNIWRYNNVKNRIGDIVIGQFFNARKNLHLRDEKNNDMLLPKKEQIFNDFMRKRDNIRAVIKSVFWEKSKPIILLSRIVPNFIKKLFEQEIPEILDGFIIVKQVVRIPGEKSKVSVESSDPHIEPLGTCLGIKGFRIHSIVKELKTETIDLIKYSKNIQLYVLLSLNTTKISMIEIDKQNKTAMISLKYEQVSKVIGQKGNNIRLAEKLTDCKINILRLFYNKYHKYEEDISKFIYKIILKKKRKQVKNHFQF